MRKFTVVGCLALAALVGLVGCADRSTPQDKQDTLCADLGAMDGSVTQLAALTPTATVQQVKTLKAKIDVQYKVVLSAAKNVSAFSIGPVTDAYNQLTKVVNTVTTQDALVAALPQIGDAAGALSDARLQVNTSGGCS